MPYCSPCWDRYAEHGIDDMTSSEVLRVEPLRLLGSDVEIAREFGGPASYRDRVDDLRGGSTQRKR